MGQQVDSLEYVRSILGELRTIAQIKRHKMAAYLIEMAYIEVSDVLRREHEQLLSGGKWATSPTEETSHGGHPANAQ